MGIQQICNTIKNYFKDTRKPVSMLSGILIACSMCKRPGLSTIRSTANIVADLSKLGIPTGTMPEGCDNMTVAYSYAQTDELFRALRKDAYLQGAFQPGSLNFVGTPTSPVGVNLNSGKICNAVL